MNKTLAKEVIMGQNYDMRILDLHSSKDREVSSLCQGSGGFRNLFEGRH